MDAESRAKNGERRTFREVLVRVAAKHPPRYLAGEMGINIGTLYNYTSGRGTFPPELVAPLYLATDDREIVDFMLAGTGLVAIPKPKPAHGDLVRELTRVLALLADGRPAPRRLASDLHRLAGMLLAQAREA